MPSLKLPSSMETSWASRYRSPREIDKRSLAFFQYAFEPYKILAQHPSNIIDTVHRTFRGHACELLDESDHYTFPIKAKTMHFSSRKRSHHWLSQQSANAHLYISREHPRMSDITLLSMRPLPKGPRKFEYTKEDFMKDVFNSDETVYPCIDLVAMHLYLDFPVTVTHRDAKGMIQIDRAATEQFFRARIDARSDDMLDKGRLLREWCEGSESSSHVFGTIAEGGEKEREAVRRARERRERMEEREKERMEQMAEGLVGEIGLGGEGGSEEGKKLKATVAEEKRRRKEEEKESKRWDRLTEEEKLADARMGKCRAGEFREVPGKRKWKIKKKTWKKSLKKMLRKEKNSSEDGEKGLASPSSSTIPIEIDCSGMNPSPESTSQSDGFGDHIPLLGLDQGTLRNEEETMRKDQGSAGFVLVPRLRLTKLADSGYYSSGSRGNRKSDSSGRTEGGGYEEMKWMEVGSMEEFGG